MQTSLGTPPAGMTAVLSGPFWSIDQLPTPFRSIVTSRVAGTSSGSYSSLNMALHVGDDPRRVRENRRLVFTSHKINSEEAVVAQQVHGANVALVDQDYAGCGCISHADAIPGVDALVTRTRHLPLMCFSADCLLLALADKEAGVLGLLHAGWRGMADGVIQNTIAAMVEAGARAERLIVASSPSIGPCCFEVGADVTSKLGVQHVVRERDGKFHYDLRAAARERLSGCGVAEAQIRIDSTCTCCREESFFSHRRAIRAGEKQTGRMAMIVWMEG
ncbi:MAG TPA: peptidoglycan editing factor PgeF [Planctomycetota bacterium]|nr:peptidoglycan editing factor PgeF [Planctomycetota bacterium]